MDAAVTRADGLRQASSVIQWSDAHGAFQGFESISNREMSETGRTVPDMDEPLSRYDVTVTVAYGGSHPDPAAFAGGGRPGGMAQVGEHHQRAPGRQDHQRRHRADRHAAVAVARAVVSDALNRRALSSSHSADDRAEPAA